MKRVSLGMLANLAVQVLATACYLALAIVWGSWWALAFIALPAWFIYDSVCFIWGVQHKWKLVLRHMQVPYTADLPGGYRTRYFANRASRRMDHFMKANPLEGAPSEFNRGLFTSVEPTYK